MPYTAVRGETGQFANRRRETSKRAITSLIRGVRFKGLILRHPRVRLERVRGRRQQEDSRRLNYLRIERIYMRAGRKIPGSLSESIELIGIEARLRMEI